ncbi:uncharacterized protein [Primulina eburnea]|uniref:uncharacterized protein n=1 Tax=Primulina eburnea TaxID=1245227 RepID=UPI003C6C9782
MREQFLALEELPKVKEATQEKLEEEKCPEIITSSPVLKELPSHLCYAFLDCYSSGGSREDNIHVPLWNGYQEKNLILNWEKCYFMVQEGIVLGHKVSSKGLEVFEKIKKALVTAPIIIVPDWKDPFELMCDSSDYAINLYASQTMDVAQQNYRTTEKEMIAVVFTFDKFRPYLIGTKMIRRCVAEEEAKVILEQCHSSPYGGHFGASRTTANVLQSGFYWHNFFKDSYTLAKSCDRCQRVGNISRHHEFLLTNILEVELFDVWAIATNTNDARVIAKLVHGNIFTRFGTPRAIISDEGTHFCNKIFNSLLTKYDVMHKVTLTYHPQANGQAEVSNWEIKQILEKTVKTNRKDRALKLDDALWAYRTAYKSPIGMSPYRLVFGKAYHLPMELDHINLCTVKKLNFDMEVSREQR